MEKIDRSEFWRYPQTVSFRTTNGEAQRISQVASQRNLTRSELLRNELEKLWSNENTEKKNG